MKKLFFGLAFLIAASTAFAQNTVIPNEGLSVRYSPEQIQEWVENYPQKIEILNFELQNGFEIIEMTDGKIQDLHPLYLMNYKTKSQGEIVEAIEDGNFNLFNYQYDRKQKTDTYYRIGNTNQVLKIISSQKLVKRFNKSRNYEK
ncbi:MAG: hypothetical protein PF448_07410 [Bacteroidales bacterium]|nr:hypothetical protein [Bacteroidales bacterium]